MKTLVKIVATVIAVCVLGFGVVALWFGGVAPMVVSAPTAEERIALAEHALAAIELGDRAAFEATLTDDASHEAFDVCAAIVADVDLSTLQLHEHDGATVEFVAADGTGVIVPVIEVNGELRVVHSFVVR